MTASLGENGLELMWKKQENKDKWNLLKLRKFLNYSLGCSNLWTLNMQTDLNVFQMGKWEFRIR